MDSLLDPVLGSLAGQQAPQAMPQVAPQQRGLIEQLLPIVIPAAGAALMGRTVPQAIGRGLLAGYSGYLSEQPRQPTVQERRLAMESQYYDARTRRMETQLSETKQRMSDKDKWLLTLPEDERPAAAIDPEGWLKTHFAKTNRAANIETLSRFANVPKGTLEAMSDTDISRLTRNFIEHRAVVADRPTSLVQNRSVLLGAADAQKFGVDSKTPVDVMVDRHSGQVVSVIGASKRGGAAGDKAPKLSEVEAVVIQKHFLGQELNAAEQEYVEHKLLTKEERALKAGEKQILLNQRTKERDARIRALDPSLWQKIFGGSPLSTAPNPAAVPQIVPDAQAGAPAQADLPTTQTRKTLNGKNYIQSGGQWYEE